LKRRNKKRKLIRPKEIRRLKRLWIKELEIQKETPKRSKKIKK